MNRSILAAFRPYAGGLHLLGRSAIDLMNYRGMPYVLGALAFFFPISYGYAEQEGTERENIVIARIANVSEAKPSTELVVKSEGRSIPAYIRDPSGSSISVAILLDAGPSQAPVLASEKDVAASVIRGLLEHPAKFVVGRLGLQGKLFPSTSDGAVAVRTIQEIRGDTGKNTDVPIYDLAAAAIHELAADPGIRVLIFIGGGKDLGSKLSYRQLRSLAEANHVACFVLLSADRSHRGPRAMLSHGWWMRELADDTAGIFLENEKTPKATAKVLGNIRALRLMAFKMDYKKPGRHEIAVKTHPPVQLRVQKAVFTEATE
jgi:hypothetical protein